MKTLLEVIAKLRADEFITSEESEELIAKLDSAFYPIDIDSNGDVWLYRRKRFPVQYKGYAN